MLFPYTFRPDRIRVPHLVTIPYSHYCEVARWALERAGIEFREAKYAPGYHARVVGRLRKDRAHRSSSSYVGQESGVHGGRRKYSVPLLCMPGGKVLRDSWEILEHSLGAPDPEWKEIIDQELGVGVRQIAYHPVLTDDGFHMLKTMVADSSPVERASIALLGRPIMREMRRLMAITDENVSASEARVLGILDKASEALRANDGALTPGGGFGPTELAFCGLAAIGVYADGYGGGAATMPALSGFSPRFRDFVARCRDTEAGAWVLKSYAEERSVRGVRDGSDRMPGEEA